MWTVVAGAGSAGSTRARDQRAEQREKAGDRMEAVVGISGSVAQVHWLTIHHITGRRIKLDILSFHDW